MNLCSQKQLLVIGQPYISSPPNHLVQFVCLFVCLFGVSGPVTHSCLTETSLYFLCSISTRIDQD